MALPRPAFSQPTVPWKSQGIGQELHAERRGYPVESWEHPPATCHLAAPVPLHSLHRQEPLSQPGLGKQTGTLPCTCVMFQSSGSQNLSEHHFARRAG